MTREGFLFPLPFLLIAVLFMILFGVFMKVNYAYISSVFFFLGLVVMLFFRDPDRKVPEGNKLIISPADGRVIRLQDIDGRPSISIFLSIFNVHVNRSPVTGTIKSVAFRPGRFFSAFKDRAMKENQRNEIEFETEFGTVLMNQVTGSIARRTIFYHKAGDSLSAGQRVGLIRFGSRVDLLLPQGSELDIKLKQKVVGGKTVLGRLP